MSPPHLTLLNRRLLDVAAGRCRRLLVSMPPRHGKSELVSRYFPAWYLGTFPDRRVILTSYEADFAASWGRKARDVLTANRGLFGVSVSVGSSAANRWDLAGREGGMVTAGVGGPITGKGADVLVIDDPVKNSEESRSPAHREKAWDWYRSTAYTRLEPGGAVVLVMTRWNRDDLAGRILAQSAEFDAEPWDEIRLPALAVEGHRDPIGRKPGEALWPARYPAEVLRGIRQTAEPYWWAALYQQQPAPEGGSEWPDSWFGPGIYFAEWPDARDICTIALDPSKGADAKFGDYSAYAVLTRTADGNLWCEVHQYRHDSEKIVDTLLDLCRQYRPDGVAVETNQFQQLLVTSLNRRAKELGVIPPAVHEIDNRVKKEVRIRRLGPYLGRRQLRFKGGHAGTRLAVEQLKQFPLADHDDAGDAVEMALRIMIELWNGRQGQATPRRLRA